VANGILQNLPQLITAAFQIITSLVSFLYQNLPTILEAGANLLLGLVNGIIDNLPEIAVAAIEGITTYVTAISSMLPQILQKGIEIIGQLVVGLIQAIPKIIAAIPQIIAGVTTTLMEFDWAGTGMDIVNGIVEGIKNAGSNILDALWSSVKDAIDWVKEKLGIASPSKYMADNVGKWMAMGVGVGFEDNIPETEMADTVKNTTLSMDTAVNSGVASNTNGISYEAIYEAVKAGAEAAHLEIDIDGRDLTRTLKGLGVAMA
jgi:phage-related protein